MASHFQFLRTVKFFDFLSDSEIQKIEAKCREEEYAPGELIFAEGSRKDKFFIILDGKVEIWKDYRNPDGVLLAHFDAGKMFGEMALIDDLPRSATVIAKRPTRLLGIKQGDFSDIILRNRNISLSIMKSLSSMLRESNELLIQGLREKNRQLVLEIEERKKTNEDLTQYREHLEELVNDRTRELASVNVSLRKQIEARKQTEKNLKEALSKVVTLSGLLPICISCKKIRDDKGYWRRIETFIRDHSQAELRESLCPECSNERYAQYYK